MRRSRAGTTSKSHRRPNSSMSSDLGDNVRDETKRPSKKESNERQPNSTSSKQRKTSDSPRRHVLPAWPKPTYPTLRPSIPPNVLSNDPHATQSTSSSGSTQLRTHHTAANPTRSTATVSAPSSPDLHVVSSDDDSLSSDDEQPTPANTISIDVRQPIPCIHHTTRTRAYNTRRILGRPYRKTMLSLLCGVRSKPVDDYSAARSATATGRNQVYACYQQHWNPKLNIPVLTIVGCCNVNISQPIIKRTLPDRVLVTLIATTSTEQSVLEFDVPLHLPLANVTNTMELCLGPHHPLPDSLTSWFVRAKETLVTLTWIKIWHLSQEGCYNLHNQGLIVPSRPFPESEIHILGLTGKRTMPYSISQITLTNNYLQLLDDIDIGNLGYKLYEPQTKPTMPLTGAHVYNLGENLFPRNNYAKNWFYDNGTMKQPEYTVRRWPDYEPIHYPPLTPHNLTNHLEFPDPALLLQGNNASRQPLILPTTTLEDMITEAVRKSPNEDPIHVLMVHFNINRRDINTRYMKVPFTTFLDEYQLPENAHNGVCQFTAHIGGHNTGERYLIPKTWIKLENHPGLSIRR